MITLLRLAILNHRMRSNAETINWLCQNVEYGNLRIAECERLQKRLQAEAWALESPSALARRSRA